MRKIDLIVCNPINGNQLAAARQQVEGILAKNPEANLTWLQSSASRTLEGGTLAAQHVLTCAVEYEEKYVPQTAQAKRPPRPPPSKPFRKG